MQQYVSQHLRPRADVTLGNPLKGGVGGVIEVKPENRKTETQPQMGFY